jgi:hypothetical protein
MRVSSSDIAPVTPPQEPEVQGGDEESSQGCQRPGTANSESRCLQASSWFEAMRMLDRGEVDAVVGDWAQLSYLARLPVFDERIHVQSAAFKSEPYGWGVNPQRPELLYAINRELIERIRNPQWRYFVQEYLGTGSIGSN